jgi:hypothetical protein
MTSPDNIQLLFCHFLYCSKLVGSLHSQPQIAPIHEGLLNFWSSIPDTSTGNQVHHWEKCITAKQLSDTISK